MSKHQTITPMAAASSLGSDAVVRESEQQPKGHIFISYSRKDMAFVDRLEDALKARGFEPLIDRTEIYAFEAWWERIEALIARADTVVFVLSPDAVASHIALKEVAHAVSLNKRFAPIVCRRVEDGAVPQELARLNFIFFDDLARFEQSVDQLAEALHTDIGWIRQHTEFGQQARHWALAKRPKGLLLRSPTLEEAEHWIASRPSGAPAPTNETRTFIRWSRQATTRRRNILIVSLVAGLVLALGLAGLAQWQRGVAVDQRDKATHNFKLAQQTAESLVFNIAQGLRDVQGMSASAVRKILETARATFEQLTASAPGDLDLQRSRAVMLAAFGNTYLRLGDLDEALTAFRDSLAITQRLAATDPGNTRWQGDLFLVYANIGDVLMAQGHLDDALRAYRDGFAIAELLARSEAGNNEWQRDLSIAYEKIADVLMTQWKLDQSLMAYRDSLAIRKRLAAGDPTNTEWQDLLSRSYDNVGDVLMAQGMLDQALMAYRDSLAIRERLGKVDPTNTQWQRDLAVSYKRVGDALMAKHDLKEALQSYRESLFIAERLARADPGNTGWQRDLAIYRDNIGDVLQAQGELSKALEAYRESLAIRERLAKADPGNANWQRDLCISHENVGDVLKAEGKLDEALRSYHDGLVIIRRLAAMDRNNKQWKQDLQIAAEKIGGIAYRFILARNFTMGLETADEAIAIASEKIWIHANRAHALMFLGRTDEARTIYFEYRGKKEMVGTNSWETAVLNDFAELREGGLVNPLMDEIEREFRTSG